MLQKIIDPTHINNKENDAILKDLFSKYQSEHYFKQNKPFLLGDFEVFLTKTVLRSSKDATKYYIISSKDLGRGNSCVAYPIEYELCLSNDETSATCIPLKTPRIAKYQSSNISSESELTREKRLSQHEYEQSKEGHLDAEPPIFSTNDEGTYLDTFIVMNQMPGTELFDFLVSMLDPNVLVSSHIRLLLTLDLLATFKEQVVLPKKAHCDLKPENIMFWLNKDNRISYLDFLIQGGLRHASNIPQWKLNVIDFADSAYFGESRESISFTPNYAAPEVLRGDMNPDGTYVAVKDERTDLVSIAIIIGIIWGLAPTDLKSFIASDFTACALNFTNDLFRDEPQAFMRSVLLPIYSWIYRMMDPDIEKRWSLQQSLTLFNSLLATNAKLGGFYPVRPATPIEISEECEALGERKKYSPISITELRDESEKTVTAVLDTKENESEEPNIIAIVRSSPTKFTENIGALTAAATKDMKRNEPIGCGCSIS